MPENFEGVVGYCSSHKFPKGDLKTFCLNGNEAIKFFIAFRPGTAGYGLVKNGARLKVRIRPDSQRTLPDGITYMIINRAVLADTNQEVAVDTSVTPDWEQADLF